MRITCECGKEADCPPIGRNRDRTSYRLACDCGNIIVTYVKKPLTRTKHVQP